MKRKFGAVLLLCLTLWTTLCGCARGAAEQTAYIGIISAMDIEIDILLEEAQIERVDTVAGIDYHVGTLRGQPVVISRAGIGKIRAASGITTMLNRYPVSKVIFTGIAGGVSEETQVLDEVIAADLVEHDYGILSNDGFVWRSGDPGIGDEAGVYYACDPGLVELAYNAAVEVVGEEHAFRGTIATGDQFIENADTVKRLKEDYDAYACEMEGAAIEVVCLGYGTPFVVIRAVSDKADGEAHGSYESFGEIAADHSSKIVLKMLEKTGK